MVDDLRQRVLYIVHVVGAKPTNFYDGVFVLDVDPTLGATVEILVRPGDYFLGVTPIARCHSPETSQPAAALRIRSALASLDRLRSSSVHVGGFQR